MSSILKQLNGESSSPRKYPLQVTIPAPMNGRNYTITIKAENYDASNLFATFEKGFRALERADSDNNRQQIHNNMVNVWRTLLEQHADDISAKQFGDVMRLVLTKYRSNDADLAFDFVQPYLRHGKKPPYDVVKGIIQLCHENPSFKAKVENELNQPPKRHDMPRGFTNFLGPYFAGSLVPSTPVSTSRDTFFSQARVKQPAVEKAPAPTPEPTKPESNNSGPTPGGGSSSDN
jgi:hypothetical protein